MQAKTQQPKLQELLNSLSPQERERVNCSINEYAKKREEGRYARLQEAEIVKSKFIQELCDIEYEIAENDDWYIKAKEGKIYVTSDTLNLHRRKAGQLYSRKRMLIDRLLPEAESGIQAVIAQIENEEAQESSFRRRDLERLLQPFYEKRLNRLRTEELVRSRILLEERRKTRSEDIRKRVYAREIPYLVHFTPIVNVESIVRNGLRSRSSLTGHEYVFTDEHRSDGWLNWISVSVSFPNYKMLYAKRKSLKNVKGWAIILVNREVLWELDCKFILTNAASFGIRMFRDDKWSSVEAFEDMFNFAEHRTGIPDCFTTDPQAEVMIRDEVPRQYIGTIALEGKSDVKLLGNLEGIRLETIPSLFKWRSDYKHWRQFRLSPFPTESKQVTPY